MTAMNTQDAKICLAGVASESFLLQRKSFPAVQNPAAVYLASLSPGSRRSMKTALNIMAGYLTSDRCDAFSLDWGALRFQHTTALRAVLAEHYAPASANHRPSALRRVLKTAWNLGWTPSEAYHRAINISPVRGDILGPMLFPDLKSERIIFRQLTDEAVLTILLKRCEQAGVKHLSPHDLRWTFIPICWMPEPTSA